MLLQLYMIISLMVFTSLVLSGSTIELALIKSMVTYSVCILLTRITKSIIEIIRKNPIHENDAETTRQ